MQFILIVVFFLIFLAVAPRFFKWLLLIDVLGMAVFFIYLKIFVGGFGKGQGTLADKYLDPMLGMLFAAPGIVILGLLSALGMHFLKNRKAE